MEARAEKEEIITPVKQSMFSCGLGMDDLWHNIEHVNQQNDMHKVKRHVGLLLIDELHISLLASLIAVVRVGNRLCHASLDIIH